MQKGSMLSGSIKQVNVGFSQTLLFMRAWQGKWTVQCQWCYRFLRAQNKQTVSVAAGCRVNGLHVFLPLWDSAPLFIWPLCQSDLEQSNNRFSANIFDATLHKRDPVCFSETKPWRWPGSPGIVVVSRGYRARARHAAARFEKHKSTALTRICQALDKTCVIFFSFDFWPW